MRLKEKRVAEILAEIRARIEGLERDCPEFCRRANTDMDDGISGISYDGGSRRSGPADPVGDRAGRRDIAGTQARQLWQALNVALDAVRTADKKAWALLPMDGEEAKTLTEADEVQDRENQKLMRDCKNPNCDHYFTGGNDRPRGGLCDPCRKYRDNHGVDRPKLLCDATSNIREAFGLDESRVLEAS